MIVIRWPFESQEHYDARKEAANDRHDERVADRREYKLAKLEAKNENKADRRDARQERVETRQDARSGRVETRQDARGARVDSRQAGKDARTQTRADAGYYDMGPSEAFGKATDSVSATVHDIAGAASDVLGGSDGGGLLSGLAGGAVSAAAPYLIGGVILIGGIVFLTRSGGAK